MTHRTKRHTRIELAAVGVAVGVVALGAGPKLQDGREFSNETSAIASLKVTDSAQAAYAASCGNGGYAAHYIILGTPPVAGGHPFISADLGGALAPEKNSYLFGMGAGLGNEVGPNDCLPDTNPTNTTYYATAVPLTFGQTGDRSYAVNADGTIWQDDAAAAPMEPFGAPAKPVR